MWTVPNDLEDVVLAATRDVLGDSPLTTAHLTRSIIDRSRRYTSDRDRLASPADRKGDLAARAAFFTIADAMKVAVPLAELAGRGALPSRRPLRIVDVGAGCGAMTLGLVAHLGNVAQGGPAFDILAIDRDVDALRIAGAAIRGLAARRDIDLSITTRSADVAETALPPCDMVLMGTVLNELDGAARHALVQRALAAIAEDGVVIAIEPALRDTSRALHEVRDAIIESGAARVFAPCTRTCAPCPALADPDDWCHEDRALELPPRAAELARMTHLRDSGMKFSYLVLRRSDAPRLAAASDWRVVSAPRAAKGKLEIFGCNETGRIPLRLLKRNRADENRAFEDARRGDIIVTSAVPDGERVEIGRETPVEVLRPAGR
jgi:ribosomal protein RSM22 (predicted rRNA methylase)